jgi:hypothetical protein
MITTLALGGAAGLLLGGVAGAAVGWWYRGDKDAKEALNTKLESQDEPGQKAVLPAPEMSNSVLSLFRQSRHQERAQKLAQKGYVKWFKFDGMLKRPQWVKPVREGSGVPRYYDSDDDVHYFFPEDALVTDARTGAPVAVHHAGQVEPVNLADPEYPPIDADRLEEIINLEIESDPPGWLSKMDFDTQTLMFGMIALILLFAGAQQML